MQNSLDQIRLATIRDHFPREGLFAEKDWLISPEPFLLSDAVVDRLEQLGHWLAKFIRASSLIYLRSQRGSLPPWVAAYLDAGKPAELLEAAHQFPHALPQVIRPDIILSEQGWVISELDSVPGGIGLTAWLNETYAALGYDVVGGADGMLKGFSTVFPEGVIAVSEESATYRPEMQWLARRLQARYGRSWSVAPAEEWDFASAEPVYRFFELYDLPNLPSRSSLLAAVNAGTLRMTPPLRPALEEKMLLGLFWSKALQSFWRRELRSGHFAALRRMIPQTWVLDPTRVPHHAVIPGLEIQSWDELKEFSQKQRDYILKVSGFSERAWGSRGVYVGTDLPQQAWAARIDEAVASFPINPFVLQRFQKGKLYHQRYLHPATGEMRTMRGRVRLCPYFFVTTERDVRLGGALVTIVPADKKIVHGMRDGIIVPAAIGKNPDE